MRGLWGLLVIAYAIRAGFAIPVWQSDRTLWAQALEQSPMNPRAQSNLLKATWTPGPAWGPVYEDHAWMEAATQPLHWRARPVSVALWRVLAGASPLVQHGVNVGVHLMNALLLGGLAWRLGLSRVSSSLTGAVFFVHPLQVEAVAYLSGRAELLAAAGVLGALLVWHGGRGAWSPVLAVPLLLWALLSKETAIVGLVLAVLVAGRRSLAGALLGLLLVVVGLFSAFVLMQPPSVVWAVWQLTAAGRLFWTALLPLTLTVDYDYAVTAGWLRVVWLMTLPTVLLLAWALRSRVMLGLSWIGAVVALRLVLVTPRSFMNEHQWYLATAGFALCLGALCDRERV